MWFTRLSIQRPVFVVVLMLTILVLGFRSLSSINIDLNPQVNFPYVTISAVYPGTSAEEIETTVSKPIEDAVSSVTGIEHITSTSQYGQSTVSIQFSIGVDPDKAENDVREKVDAIKGALPRDMDPPTVAKFDFSDQPVITFGMESSLPLKQARFLAQKIVEPDLSQVPGVARVDVTGGDTREIQVNVDRSRLAAYGISITDVLNAIENANLNISAGHIEEGRFDFDARVLGEFQSLDEIRDLQLPMPSKDPTKPLFLRLSDIATVKDTVAERTNISRIWSHDASGKLAPAEAVTLVVTKSSDANTTLVADGVKSVMERLKKELPGTTKFVINIDQSKLVRDQLNDIVVSLIAGATLAVLVVFFFLHDIRGTLICAVAIPMSLIATFIPMYFAGFTLNSMTMMALSLVVGILVDDSIVVLENIHRHLARGEQPSEAAYNGRSEIGLAAVTITMVDVAVFLPMAWMGGIVGQFFREFGLTVACSTLFSLLVSFSVTPMLASRLYRSAEDVDEDNKGPIARGFERFFHGLDNGYGRLLGSLVRRWFIVRALFFLGGYAALIVIGGAALPHLGFQFTPVTDQGQIVVSCEMPTGTSLAATDAVTSIIEKRLATIPEADTMYTNVGSLATSRTPELGPQYAQINVMLLDKPSAAHALNPFWHGRARHRPDVVIAAEMRKMLADIPGARIVVVPVSGFGGSQAPVDIELLGLDLKHLDTVAEQMRDKIKAVPGIMDPDISNRPGKPEAEIVVDRDKAAAYGYSVEQIGNAVRVAFAGDTTSKFRDQGDQFDIRVQLAGVDRTNIESLGSLIVGTRGTYGNYEPVYLRDVASITMGSGPTEIDRLDRQRVVHVTAYLQPGRSLGNMQKPINDAVQSVPLGNIQKVWGGQAEQMGKEFGYLFATLALSIVLVYLLMAALFDSLLTPLIIQASMPMALLGAILALVITHKTMSIIAMIGVIMLVGLVQKNAILLVDYTNTLKARGLPRNEAVERAGHTRLRPILMTTVAMIFGMMPLATGIGTSSESRAPLAVCVIGGLIVSTALTLVMIPVAYTLMDDIVKFVTRPFRNGRTHARTRVRTPRSERPQ